MDRYALFWCVSSAKKSAGLYLTILNRVELSIESKI